MLRLSTRKLTLASSLALAHELDATYACLVGEWQWKPQILHEKKLCSQHGGRSTVWPKDSRLVQQIKPDDVVLRGWVPCGPLKPPRVAGAGAS